MNNASHLRRKQHRARPMKTLALTIFVTFCPLAEAQLTPYYFGQIDTLAQIERFIGECFIYERGKPMGEDIRFNPGNQSCRLAVPKPPTPAAIDFYWAFTDVDDCRRIERFTVEFRPKNGAYEATGYLMQDGRWSSDTEGTIVNF